MGAGNFLAYCQLSCLEVSVLYSKNLLKKVHDFSAPILCPNNCTYPYGTCNENGTCECTGASFGEDCGTFRMSTCPLY